MSGFNYSKELKLPILVPSISTTSFTSVTYTSISSGGTITSDGGAHVTARGVCWSTNQNPFVTDNKTTDGIGTGTFTSSITGLTPGVTYYVRAYATNSAGTSYGNQIILSIPSTNNGDTVIDIDGNVYQTVVIGTQVWMEENLKTTKYRNGDSIPNVIDPSNWESLTTGAYCWYNNDASYKSIYGALYNGFVLNDSRNIAPVGWHLPSDDEWKTLEKFLGMNSWDLDNEIWRYSGDVGMKIKSISGWANNSNGDNSSGFNALPGSFRQSYGGFDTIGYYEQFWSSTIVGSDAWIRYVTSGLNAICRPLVNLKYGYSIRCIKD